jgi:hypothetical protein
MIEQFRVDHSPAGVAWLRALARDDERAARDEPRIGSRLRADLLAVSPTAIDIAAGHSHYAALRALGNRWPEVPWHCLRVGVSYHEAIHTANRSHALRKAACG